MCFRVTGQAALTMRLKPQQSKPVPYGRCKIPFLFSCKKAMTAVGHRSDRRQSPFSGIRLKEGFSHKMIKLVAVKMPVLCRKTKRVSAFLKIIKDHSGSCGPCSTVTRKDWSSDFYYVIETIDLEKGTSEGKSFRCGEPYKQWNGRLDSGNYSMYDLNKKE